MQKLNYHIFESCIFAKVGNDLKWLSNTMIAHTKKKLNTDDAPAKRCKPTYVNQSITFED